MIDVMRCDAMPLDAMQVVSQSVSQWCTADTHLLNLHFVDGRSVLCCKEGKGAACSHTCRGS